MLFAAFLRSKKQVRKMAVARDRSPQVKDKPFQIGEFVVKRLPGQMTRKLKPAWEEPFIVAGVGPHDFYRLQAPNGQIEKHPVNGNHLAPWMSDGLMMNIYDTYSQNPCSPSLFGPPPAILKRVQGCR
jgi:hypothetical protein